MSCMKQPWQLELCLITVVQCDKKIVSFKNAILILRLAPHLYGFSLASPLLGLSFGLFTLLCELSTGLALLILTSLQWYSHLLIKLHSNHYAKLFCHQHLPTLWQCKKGDAAGTSSCQVLVHDLLVNSAWTASLIPAATETATLCSAVLLVSSIKQGPEKVLTTKPFTGLYLVYCLLTAEVWD